MLYYIFLFYNITMTLYCIIMPYIFTFLHMYVCIIVCY